MDPNRYPRRMKTEKESATEQQADGNTPIHELDRPRTFREAAAHLGVGYHVIRGAARRGLVRTFRIASSRQYVTMRDFLELMARDNKILTGE